MVDLIPSEERVMKTVDAFRVRRLQRLHRTSTDTREAEVPKHVAFGSTAKRERFDVTADDEEFLSIRQKTQKKEKDSLDRSLQ